MSEEEAARPLRAVATSAAAALAASSPAPAVILSGLLSAFAADSAVRAIVGSRFKERDRFLALLEHGIKLFAKMSLPDLYPSSRLALLVSRMPRRMMQHREEGGPPSWTPSSVSTRRRRLAGRAPEDPEEQRDLQFPISTDNIKSTVGVIN